MSRVVILQDYIPQYRAPLFDRMKEQLAAQGISLTVAAGLPSGTRLQRNDSAHLDWATPLWQRELRVFGRRVTLRDTRSVITDADLVIMEQARRNVDAYRLLAKRRRPPTALWGHGADRTRNVSAVERGLSRWLLRRCDWFFAYTDGAGRLAEDSGVDGARVTVLRNAVDTSALQQAIATIDAATREEFAKSLDLRGTTALYIGALDTYKRIPMLIETADAAHAADSDFRLIIAGDGADRDLVEQAVTTRPFIRYVGPKFGADKALILAASDILISPGSVGLGVLDSFAARIPMVITEWPFHGPEAEYLEHGRNAIVTKDSVDDFARGILAALASPSTMKRLTANCASDARLFTIENMANRFVEGIRRALETPPR